MNGVKGPSILCITEEISFEQTTMDAPPFSGKFKKVSCDNKRAHSTLLRTCYPVFVTHLIGCLVAFKAPFKSLKDDWLANAVQESTAQ